MGVIKKIAGLAGILFLAALGAMLIFTHRAAAADKTDSIDQLVTQHLDSIGDAKARGEIKSRVVQGPMRFNILVGGSGTLEGKTVLASEGEKLHVLIKLPNNDYRGEQFIYDGKKDDVAFATDRQTRSAFGTLVFVQDAILREGLIGGVLSTAWPLLDLNDRKPKLHDEGIKNVDGRQVRDLRYQPRKSTDLEIHLYFDVSTGHHVETLYRYEIRPGLVPAGSVDSRGVTTGLSPEVAAARQQTTRYRLEEKFDDFKTADGLTLPTHYDIEFTEELQNGKTVLSQWDAKGLEITNNISLDPRNFEVK